FDCKIKGVSYPRVRSISMNGFVLGTGVYGSDVVLEPTVANGFFYYRKLSDITKPSPSGLFVTLDEHPDSINDAFFFPQVNEGTWGDMPASYHDGAGGFSFADGHSEIHKWRYPGTIQPVRYVAINGAYPGKPWTVDTTWMINHTTYKPGIP